MEKESREKNEVNLNNFYLNEHALRDCLKYKFTFLNITEEEMFRCFYDSDTFLEKIKDMEHEYSNIQIRLGPELHHGTLPYRKQEIREKANIIRPVSLPRKKHVFGEGLIRIVFNINNIDIGYISFCIYKKTAFLGNIQTLINPSEATNISREYLKKKPVINIMFYTFKNFLSNHNIKEVYCASTDNKLGWRHDRLGQYWRGTCYDRLFKSLGGKFTENKRWLFAL